MVKRSLKQENLFLHYAILVSIQSTYTTNRSIQIIREIDRNFRKIEAAAYVVEASQRDIHWHLNGRTTWRIVWLAGVRTSSSKGLSLVQHCLVQHSDVSLA